MFTPQNKLPKIPLTIVPDESFSMKKKHISIELKYCCYSQTIKFLFFLIYLRLPFTKIAMNFKRTSLPEK